MVMGSRGAETITLLLDPEGRPVAPQPSWVAESQIAGDRYTPPVIAGDPDENVVGLWSRALPGGASVVVGQHLVGPGAADGLVFELAEPRPAESRQIADLAAAAPDVFLAVWGERGWDWNFMAWQRFRSDGTLLPTATHEIWVGGKPRVAVSGDGRGLVVGECREPGSSYAIICAQLIGPEGELLGPSFVMPRVLGGDQKRPVVAVDGAGRFLVAWYEQDPKGKNATLSIRRFR
ncbi:MAG: hypothetical protein HC897_02960 [Thermoanaerobaculia bacterium]|nr:hypothetical protein [Thermoanaerobaculia bacterium]